jgi:hypothetical protein
MAFNESIRCRIFSRSECIGRSLLFRILRLNELFRCLNENTLAVHYLWGECWRLLKIADTQNRFGTQRILNHNLLCRRLYSEVLFFPLRFWQLTRSSDLGQSRTKCFKKHQIPKTLCKIIDLQITNHSFYLSAKVHNYTKAIKK